MRGQREGPPRVGLVVVGRTGNYEVLGFEPLVVFAADGDQVVDVGVAVVAVPLLDFVEFAAVHGALQSKHPPSRTATARRWLRPSQRMAGPVDIIPASSVSGVRVLRISRDTGPTPIIST